MTNIHRVCSKSEDETRTLAAQMAGDILPVTVIALFGDLGTGKTIIEWANIIQDLLPDDTIIIQFERVPKKPTERIISFNGWNR